MWWTAPAPGIEVPYVQIFERKSPLFSAVHRSLLAHSVIRRAAIFLDAIGGIADIDRHERWTARSRLTQLRHWLCTAAMFFDAGFSLYQSTRLSR
jgi:hypothetical protein